MEYPNDPHPKSNCATAYALYKQYSIYVLVHVKMYPEEPDITARVPVIH